jgi:hypothetical protein
MEGVDEKSMPQSKLKHDMVAGLVIFVGSAAGFAHTFTMYPEAAVFPRFILGFMALLSIYLVVKNHSAGQAEAKREAFFIYPPRLLLILVLMLSYMFLVNRLGYYTSTLIFLPGTAYALGFRNLVYIAMTTLLYLLFVFLVFNTLFSLPFPAEFFQH